MSTSSPPSVEPISFGPGAQEPRLLPSWWPAGRAADALAMGLYLVLSFAIQAQVWLAGVATHSVGRPDPEVHVAYTGWFPYAIAKGFNPFFNPTMAAPGGVNMLRNTTWPLLSALASPSTVLFGPIFSWNLLNTLAPATTAMATYALCRRLRVGRGGSFLGGLLFAFSAFELASLRTGHLQGSFVALLPLAVLCLIEVLDPDRLRPLTAGVLLGLCLGGEFLISAELLSVELVVLPFGALIALAVIPSVRTQWRGALIGGVSAIATTLAIVAYPYWYYLHGPQAISGPVQLVAQAYRVDLAAFVMPTTHQLFSTPGINETTSLFSNAVGENGAYLGLGLLAFCIATVVLLRRDRRVLAIAATGTFAALLSLGGSLTVTGAPQLDRHGGAKGSLALPEALLAKLPGLVDVIPSKFVGFAALGAALVAAIGIDRLSRRLSKRPGSGVLLLAVASLLALPLWPAPPTQKVVAYHEPAFFSSKAYHQLPDRAMLLTVPYPASQDLTAARWLAQQRYRFSMPMSHVKVPNEDGTVAFDPSLGYGPVSMPALLLTKVGEGTPVAVDDATKAQFLHQLTRWKTRAVVTDLRRVRDPNLMRLTLFTLLGPPSGGGTDEPYWLLPSS